MIVFNHWRAVIILTLIVGGVPAALADSALMRGIDAYERNELGQAQAYFRQAIKAAPEDSLAHYYLGNTLVKLKKLNGAKAEFKLASDNSETDDIKENCKIALQKLNPSESKKVNQTGAPSVRLDSLPFTVEEKKIIAPYLKHNGELEQTKSASMIKDLLPADLKNRAQALGPKDQSWPGLLSDLLGQTQFGNAMSAAERKSFIEEELHKRNIPIESILQIINAKSGATSASKPSIVQDERTKRLKEVQDNLDDQMNSKVGNSKVHLKHEGTSIYVRNYEHH